MIENTKKSERPGIKYSRKDYWLVSVGNKPEGMCTKIETAMICAAFFAKKYDARMIGEKLPMYIYDDDSGQHFITIQRFKRMSFGNVKDDED